MARLEVRTQNKRFPTEKSLYGLFFEDINRAGDSGIYPEMIRNRAFEDGIIPDDLKEEENFLINEKGWKFEFNHGEGTTEWARRSENTSVCGWYTWNAEMRITTADTLNEARKAALSVIFDKNGTLYNIGFCGISLQKSMKYNLTIFAKADKAIRLTCGAVKKNIVSCKSDVVIQKGDYEKYELTLAAMEDLNEGEFFIKAPEGGSVVIGYISLIPCDTFRGHGLRKDLCERLENLHPGFLRFPGGCIVEGFSKSTIPMFHDSIGPVWERKSLLNLWGYRSTQGLGYYEYLQLCEDIGADALYVCNCGMTCQARNSLLLDSSEYDVLLQDTLDAIEYALGDDKTFWGRMRISDGHADPFPLKYIEIGNENNGQAYEERYRYFYEAIHGKYPELLIVANTHVEKSGLHADIVDEHFYDRAEWFAMNTHFYEKYDRNKPGIFVGEYATVSGNIRTLYCALGEAMFLMGLERNQDVVKLASYAPLFENKNYAAWEPNLIVFDQKDNYVIPTYHVIEMFASARGNFVLDSIQESEILYPTYLKGGPCVCASDGVLVRGMRWKEKNESFARKLIGHAEEMTDTEKKDGVKEYLLITEDSEQAAETAQKFEMADRVIIMIGEDTESVRGKVTLQMKVPEGKCAGIGMFCSPYGKSMHNAASPWNLFSVQPITWTVESGVSKLTAGIGFRRYELCKSEAITIDHECWYEYAMESDGRILTCTLNGQVVHKIELPHFESIQTVALEAKNGCIIKIVNIKNETQQLQIRLDRKVCAEYTARVLTGRPEDKNTMESPHNVECYMRSGHNASDDFLYEVPGSSVNVLFLKYACDK